MPPSAINFLKAQSKLSTDSTKSFLFFFSARTVDLCKQQLAMCARASPLGGIYAGSASFP